MLCVLIFYIKWRWTCSFKVDSEQQIFWETFHSNFIYSQYFCHKSAERYRRRNTFCILFCCLAWGSKPGFTSDKSSTSIKKVEFPDSFQLFWLPIFIRLGVHNIFMSISLFWERNFKLGNVRHVQTAVSETQYSL